MAKNKSKLIKKEEIWQNLNRLMKFSEIWLVDASQQKKMLQKKTFFDFVIFLYFLVKKQPKSTKMKKIGKIQTV